MEKLAGLHHRQPCYFENNNNESKDNYGRSILRKCSTGFGRSRASYTPYPYSLENPSLSTVELLVTNLDQRIDHYEMKRMIGNLFREHVVVRNVSVFKQTDGSIAAVVTVNSRSEAQFAISQLHKIKVGHKRIFISYGNGNCGSYSLCKEIVALLKSVPDRKTHLFKFREMFEKRYHMSIPVSDLYKMRDIVTITENSTGRLIQLKQNHVGLEDETEASMSVESLYCSKHFPVEDQKGWAENMACPPLPNVNITLKELGPKIKLLVRNHDGSLPLASLDRCYEAEFGQFEGTEGVPLEHLVAGVKGVEITTGMTGIKRLVASSGEDPLSVASSPPFHSRPPSPPMASQLLRLSREIVDLLKTYPGARMPLSKFIPDYHHYFMRQLRVADYGFTKLRELFEELPNVVQLLGEGTRSYITLAHKAQVKRFSSDLLKVLKSQASKQLSLSEVSTAFEKYTGKPFIITDYGVCSVEDLLVEVSEHVVVLTPPNILKRYNDDAEHYEENVETDIVETDILETDILISIPKKEQTPDEMKQTRHFSQEVIELLGLSPDCALPFNKFIPAYHHHYGRQCRVGDYGFSKLIEVFEALPETINILEDADGERLIQLVKSERLNVIGKQIVDVIQANQKNSMNISQIQQAYTTKFGFNLRLDVYDVETIEELLDQLQSRVKVKEDQEELIVTLVDREYIQMMAKNAQKLLMEHSEGKMDLKNFVEIYSIKFSSDIDIEMLRRDMSNVVTIVGDEYVELAPLQLVARNIQSVIIKQNKTLSVEELQASYLKLHGCSINPNDHGFANMGTLLAAIPEIVSLRGKGNRNFVNLPSASQESTAKIKFSNLRHKPVSRVKIPLVQSSASTVSFSGRGFDMIRTVAPSTDSNQNDVHVAQSTGKIRNEFSVTPQKPAYPKVVDPHPYSPLLHTTPRIQASNYISQQRGNIQDVVGYPYDSTSAWRSSTHGSHTSGLTFPQHMMQHTLSPLVHQVSPHQFNSASRSQFEAPSCGDGQISPSSVPTAYQTSLELLCEAELEKNMEKLTESIANNVLLGTSPASTTSRSATPSSPNSLSSMLRSATPKTQVPQFIGPPPSPAYRREYAPSALVDKEVPAKFLQPRLPFTAPQLQLNSPKAAGFFLQDNANSNS